MKLGRRQWIMVGLVITLCLGALYYLVSTGDLAFKPGVGRKKIQEVMKDSVNYPSTPMRFGWVKINDYTFGVEIAEDDAQRARGLMFKRELPKNEGMFFLFPESQIRGFWMKNTLLYLDLAYIDENGKILSIHAMKPLNEESVFSMAPARYVLEVGKSRLKAAKAKVGDVITWGYF